jgi:hypothetical protein
LNADVSAGSLGIRTNPVRALDEGCRDVAFHTRQAHIEPRLEEIIVADRAEINFGVDGRIRRKSYLHAARYPPHGPDETGRPAGCE